MYDAEAPLGQQWDTLARRCGCTLPAFKKAMAALQDDGKVSVGGDGIWSQKCEKHITLRRERQNSAKAAAKKRWEKTKEKQGQGDADACDPHCQPEPEPESDLLRDTKVSLLCSFDDFWKRWPNKVAKQQAKTAWKRLSQKDREAAHAAVNHWTEKWRKQYPTASPIHAATFLNKRRWEDYDSAPVAKIDNAQLERMLNSPSPAVRAAAEKMRDAR